MIKVFKEADIKGKIATIISWSMMVLSIVNIFTRNDLIRLTVWCGVVIALSLDFLIMLQLYQKTEKKLFEEQKRRINLVYDLRALRFRIEIDELNKVQTGEELDQIIDRCLNDKSKFKRVGEDQAIELSRKIDWMYACIEELLCIKAQVNVAIEKLEEIRKLEGPIAPEYLMEIIEVLQGDGI